MVPDRVKLVIKSKVSSPSGFGYSIGLYLLASPVVSLSFYVNLKVHGSLPLVILVTKPWARPNHKPFLKPP